MMSTLSTTPKPSTQPIPASIRGRLNQLRGRITRFVVIDGMSRVLAVAVALVLLDLVLDRFFKMDGAQRLVLLCGMIAILAAIVFVRLLRPLLRRVGDDALILQVENQNQQLGESLISTVQFSRQRQQWASQGYSDALVEATIRQGTGLAENIDFGSTINRPALNRNLVLLLVSLAGLVRHHMGCVQHQSVADLVQPQHHVDQRPVAAEHQAVPDGCRTGPAGFAAWRRSQAVCRGVAGQPGD